MRRYHDGCGGVGQSKHPPGPDEPSMNGWK
jgi:hypothetical protein